jgi:ABC-type nitrate/sulfonate/bicarbonate transport system permease component
VVALTVARHSGVVPTPPAIVRQMWRDRSIYPDNLHTTLVEAGEGWLVGNALAIVLGFLTVQFPLLDKALLRVGIATYALPIVAVAPILQVSLAGNQPKVALAALAVFFTTLISTILGLRSADPTMLDLVHAYGGGRLDELRKVRAKAALPSVFTGLKIAAPAAVLGAIVGEWMGGQSGLGIAMVASEQSLQVTRTWGLAIVSAGVGGLAYALTSLIALLLLPWAAESRAQAAGR